MNTRGGANVLCMHTVLRVLLCYRKALPCYRESVTGNVFVDGAMGCMRPLHSRVYPSRAGVCALACMRSRVRVCVRVCACVCVCVRMSCATPKTKGDSTDVRGGVRARTVYCSCPPDLQQVKLKKRAKKHSSQTRMNTRVGESDDLVV